MQMLVMVIDIYNLFVLLKCKAFVIDMTSVVCLICFTHITLGHDTCHISVNGDDIFKIILCILLSALCIFGVLLCDYFNCLICIASPSENRKCTNYKPQIRNGRKHRS
eukprot:811470_1